MHRTLHLETVTDLAGLEELAPQWQSLHDSCPHTTPFQSPAWLLAWWHAFAPGELHTFVIRRRRELVGIVPLYRDSGRLLPPGISLSDVVDVLVNPAELSAVAPRVAREFEGDASWTCCEWPELRPYATVWQLQTPTGASDERALSSTCPVLPVPSETRRLRDLIPAHRMQSLRTGWNRARRLGSVQVATATPSCMHAPLEVLDRLHTARWNAAGLPGVTADRRVMKFLRLALPPLIERGEAALYTLDLDGVCVAAHLVLQNRERAFSYMTGFALDACSVSPGALLLGHAIEQALLRGQCEFDFLRGDESYKYLWGALPRRNQARMFRRL